MIIKATRIKAADSWHGLWRHLMRTDENEEVRIIRGQKFNLNQAVLDAASRGGQYGLRHVMLNPELEITPEQFEACQTGYQREFGAEAPLVIVEHQKPRADGLGFERHRHLVFAECLETRRVLSSRFMRMRNEKVARLCELAWEHPLTSGKHNDQVIQYLDASPVAEMKQAAARLKQVFWGKEVPLQATFTDAAHQTTKRRAGHSVLPAMRAELRRLWQGTGYVLQTFVERAIDKGYQVKSGDKPGVWLIENTAGYHLALHRVLRLRRQDLEELMEEQDRPMPATLRKRRRIKPELLPPLPETPAYKTYMEELADIIRPPWKRSECRAELLARPYLREVQRLEKRTDAEILAELLAALIMRFLEFLFGKKAEIPPLTAQEARQRIEKEAQARAQERQEAVRAHFEQAGVQAVLKLRRLLRGCLVSQNPAVRKAMESGQFKQAVRLLEGQKRSVSERERQIEQVLEQKLGSKSDRKM